MPYVTVGPFFRLWQESVSDEGLISVKAFYMEAPTLSNNVFPLYLFSKKCIRGRSDDTFRRAEVGIYVYALAVSSLKSLNECELTSL